MMRHRYQDALLGLAIGDALGTRFPRLGKQRLRSANQLLMWLIHFTTVRIETGYFRTDLSLGESNLSS